MLDRRSFLGSLLAAPAIAAVVPDAEYAPGLKLAKGPDPEPEPPPRPGHLTLEFPGGSLLVPADAGYSQSTPWERDAFGRVLRRLPSDVAVTGVACPEAVWAEFLRTYRDVATPKPPITVRLTFADGSGSAVVSTLDHAVLTEVGCAAAANGMVVVTGLRLACVWREQEENLKAYFAEQEAAWLEHEAKIAEFAEARGAKVVPADDDPPADCFCDLCAGYDDPPADS